MVLKRYVEEENGQKFDLIIVGGGITGGAVAYIAAARGLSVALFEKKDYGGATSAATSKLIHGGLEVPGKRGDQACARIAPRKKDIREYRTQFCLSASFYYAQLQEMERQYLEDDPGYVPVRYAVV